MVLTKIQTELLNIKTYQPEQFTDLIERVWILENSDSDVELVIPPNQYASLIIPIHNSRYKRNHIWLDSPQIEGVSVQNTLLSYPANTKLIGFRFYAFGLFPIMQVQGKDLLNNSLNCSINNEITNIDKVYDILRSLFCPESYKAVTTIKDFYRQFRWGDDTQSVEEYCRKSGTNYTTLNRSFTKIVGISPKKFERLIKFRKSLCSLIDSDNKLTSIGVHSGYYDQAHFIREFKLFLNQTPSSYKKLIKQADKESKIINYNFKLF